MDNGQDATWLPLSQAGQRLGLSRGALRKRIARGRLEARKSNDGLVRVLVTGETEPGRSQDGASPVRDGASPVHGDGAGSVPETVYLLSALADARVAAARAEGECVALQAQVTDLRAERDIQAAAHARERETLQTVIGDLRAERDRLAGELALARKGWLERVLEAMRRK